MNQQIRDHLCMPFIVVLVHDTWRNARQLISAALLGVISLSTVAAGTCVNLTNTSLNVAEESKPLLAGSPNQLALLGASELDPRNRVYTQANVVSPGYSVPGGYYAAVAVDADLFASVSNASSKTPTSGAVKSLTQQLNRLKLDRFIMGHLVNQEFGGNFAGLNNFTSITARMNSAMSGRVEATAKKIMTSIQTHYYGDFKNSGWVGVSNEGSATELRYKPGIIYEAEIPDAESVYSREQSTIPPTSLISPSIPDDLKKKLTAGLEVRIRFIMHEYRFPTPGSMTNVVATGKVYDMPQAVFDKFIGNSAEKLGDRIFPPDATLPLRNATSPNAAYSFDNGKYGEYLYVKNHPSGGREWTWVFFNTGKW